MAAIVLPDIDIEELRKHVPSMASIDLPSLATAGQRADDAIDRWRGRSSGPSLPWIAAGIFTLGLIATLLALLTWSRRGAMLDDVEMPAAPGADTDLYGTESMPA